MPEREQIRDWMPESPSGRGIVLALIQTIYLVLLVSSVYRQFLPGSFKVYLVSIYPPMVIGV